MQCVVCRWGRPLKVILIQGLIEVIRKAGKIFNRRGGKMKKTTKLRLFGGGVLLFNLWLIGNYNLEGIPVIFLTLGFAVGYEYLVVRPASKSTEKVE